MKTETNYLEKAIANLASENEKLKEQLIEAKERSEMYRKWWQEKEAELKKITEIEVVL